MTPSPQLPSEGLGVNRSAQTYTPYEIAALVELFAADISADLADQAGWPLDEAAIRQRLTKILDDDFARFPRLLAELLAFLECARKADVAVQNRYAGMIQLAELARAVYLHGRRLEMAVFGAPLH